MSSIGMGQHYQQRQEQQLKLAPRMIQAMKILQMPLVELQERIDQELQENPVLELRNGDPATREDSPEETGAAESRDDFDPDGVISHDDDNLADFNRLEEMNRDWDDLFNEDHRPSRSTLQEMSDRKQEAMQNMPCRPQSLQEYLDEQLGFLDLSEDLERLVRFVIGHIDWTGYLGERVEVPDTNDKTGKGKKDVLRLLTLEELARRYDLPILTEEVEKALSIVQTLDPPGVGARDVKECLMLQLQPDTPHREIVRALIQDHLEDVEHNRLPIIQKKTSFEIGAIKEAIEVLKHLNTRPGAQFLNTRTQYVVPDVIVERNDAGDYEVRLADDWVPNIRISKGYSRMARDKSADPQTKQYLKRKLSSAQWLLEAIEQRRATLTKVTRAIVEHQREFLDKGPEFIRPLKMQQIADQVGVHVTTVSRAVDDKWVETPRGIYPLKRFFGGGKETATGESVAWEKIKRKLLELIENEDKANPLSDEELVERMNEAGYPVARRTVTKYRKMLRIPSSRQRKAW